MDADDRRLVARCLGGDQDACTELVHVHARLVGTLIWRAAGDESVVEDLAQETFMRVFRALPLFEGQAKLSTWICTIAHRVAIDHVRKAGRNREDPLVEEYEANGATPETIASSDEIACLFQSGIDQLADKYRFPLLYAAIDGLDYGTIAAMLDVPVGTVKTLVFRGKQQLKSWILKRTTR